MASRTPRERVAAPATLLLVVGVLGILSAVALAAATIHTWLEDRALSEVTLDAPDSEAEVLFDLFGLGFALMWLGVAVGIAVAVVVGARRMRRLESRTLALAGAVLAMVPINPCFVLGLPVGLWALWVLTRPAVRAAFEEGTEESDAEFWGADPP